MLALQALLAGVSLAADEAEPVLQQGEDLWVPSFAIVSGITIQKQDGTVDSVLFPDMSPTSIPLRGFVDGNDLVVSPFVGGALELMSPALPLPLRPRIFLSGELLPTFASDREVAIEGQPGCLRGPLPGSPCLSDDVDMTTPNFPENSVNGEGSSTKATIDTLVFGATLGVAFPAQLGKRQLRIKPSIGWINYKVDGEGLVVDGACNPPDQCLDSILIPPFVTPGFIRDTTLRGSGSQYFNGIGPGLDVEMDVGRYGPLGVSLLFGARAYRILGDRSFSFDASQSFDDELGNDLATASFGVEVDPWLYRANVGIRFQWLGSSE